MQLDNAFALAAQHFQNGRSKQAKEIYEEILHAHPDHPRALHALGVVTYRFGKVVEAIELVERAIEVQPNFADALNNLGNIFREQGKSQKAKLAYEKALTLNPDFTEAHYNLGNCYYTRNELSKAAACFIKAIDLKPDHAQAYNNLGMVLKNQLKLDEALESYKTALAIKPDLAEAHSNTLFAMQYSPRFTAESIFYESLAWQKGCAGGSFRRNRYRVDRDPAKKLRIGYVSADFGRHPVGYFLSPVLAAHDRTRIETYCYSGRTDEDDLTSRLKNSADNWRSTVGLNDDKLADMITSDRIDILVDLSGHTGGNRLKVFARKPAPVQATWAGYVGTTGLSAIDYLISDWQETPAGSERWCVEKVMRLPDCYICYEPPEYAPAVSPLPAGVNGFVTFGCFNNLAKINVDVIALWSRILKEVANSRLIMITKELNDPGTRKLLRKKFAAFGVADRVILGGPLRHVELLAAYHRVDIALDPFPYSGGLTTLESLWMGVPVVTLGGERFASRHTVSHLTAVGLPELVADGPDCYLARVSDLAEDRGKLEHLRQNLRARMAASPLCDAIRFTSNLETAFREMWQDWCGVANTPPPPRKTTASQEEAAKKLDRALETAAQYFHEGRLQLAESMYRQVLRDNPDHPRALHPLGIIANCYGNRDQAVNFLLRVIEITPDFADAHNDLGNILKALGKTDEAMTCYKNAVAIKPGFADALYNLGNLLIDLGRPDEALVNFRKALEAKPDYAAALCNMGVVQTDLGRPEEAVECYRKAIAVKPDFVTAYNNLANVLLDQGNREEAVACYREAVRIAPEFAEGFFNLGNALENLGDQEEAAACYRKAVRINPDFAEVYNNLGNLLRKQGFLDESVTVYRKALRLKPDFAEVHNNLGIALKEQGKIGEAVESFEQAIAFDPASAEAYSNLGDALRRLERLDEAVASCRKALGIRGDFSEAHNILGNALNKQGKLVESLASYELALAIEPDSAMAYNNLSNALTAQGRLEESLASYRQALAIKPDYYEAHSNLLVTMNYSPLCSARQIFEESLRWDEIHAELRTARQKPHPNNRDKDRRLRVGYVSPDFRKHSASYFCEPLLSAHNREEVEIYCYADVIKPDETTLRLQALADIWHYTNGMTDEALAERIRHDQIDILVDLAGHTAGNRLPAFAEKPAPIQVTWLGYPNTTGMSAMDYRLTDAVADPIEQFHSETLIRLPDGFLCYLPPSEAPRVNALPSSGKGYITFGSFNNLAKTTDEVLELWGKLLNSLACSRLILKNNSFADEATRTRYLEMFREYGVAPSRITLLSMTATTRSHLELYGRVDIALDPFPYNGTTTTCEALWMGVPVITLLGNRHAGRVGASILNRVGLDDLVAITPEEYLRLAVELANDQKRLATLRRTLRKRMTSSPLCNANNFARTVEAAFRKMWHKWCEDQK